MEIDAASNNGVENVRQITDSVRYAPTSARYKVYIVDEVHMLSAGAFNAFLKTLEEPPPHVKFIFATTEIRKVPVTVLSRCQRFDLQARRRRDPRRSSQAHLRSREGDGRGRGAGADRARRRGLGARCHVAPRPGDRAWRRQRHGRGRARHARPCRSRPPPRPFRGADGRERERGARRLARALRCRLRPGARHRGPRRCRPSRDAPENPSRSRQGRRAFGSRTGARPLLRRTPVDARLGARLADFVARASRGAGRRKADRGRRDAADPPRLRRQSADAGRGAEGAGFPARAFLARRRGRKSRCVRRHFRGAFPRDGRHGHFFASRRGEPARRFLVELFGRRRRGCERAAPRRAGAKCFRQRQVPRRRRCSTASRI